MVCVETALPKLHLATLVRFLLHRLLPFSPYVPPNCILTYNTFSICTTKLIPTYNTFSICTIYSTPSSRPLQPCLFSFHSSLPLYSSLSFLSKYLRVFAPLCFILLLLSFQPSSPLSIPPSYFLSLPRSSLLPPSL